MSIKPILFNADMVRAILDGEKTQTRRLVKPHYRYGDAVFQVITNLDTGKFCYIEYYDADDNCTVRRINPPYRPEDVLWVRETWARMTSGVFRYKADDAVVSQIGTLYMWHPYKWHPSIHMPKEAARIWLRVKNVRVERLLSMSHEDVLAEGVTECQGRINYGVDCACADIKFDQIWDSTIKPADRDKYSWQANPWVWVITFERCEKPEGWPT